MSKIETVILIRPRGFCAGVERAVRTVEECLRIFGAPVYVKHQIVHNTTVVSDLEKKGAITVEDIAEVPEGAVVVFSAHGSPPEHYEEAKRRNLRVVDATCPLVTKVHLEVHRYLKNGYDIVYIGHRGHIEGEGVRAEARVYGKDIPLIDTEKDIENIPDMPGKCVYLTQTTLSVFETQARVGALKKRFPHIEHPPIADICYATTNRQKAVRDLAKRAQVVLVVGSTASSNSNRLVECAQEEGARAFLVEDLGAVEKIDLRDVSVVGITAGASAPEVVVQSLVGYFRDLGARVEELESVSESMRFADPLELGKMKPIFKNGRNSGV